MVASLALLAILGGGPETGRALLLGTLLLPSFQLCEDPHCTPVVTAGPPAPLLLSGWHCCAKSAGFQNLGKLCLPLETGSRAPSASSRRVRGALHWDSEPDSAPLSAVCLLPGGQGLEQGPREIQLPGPPKGPFGPEGADKALRTTP